MVAIRDQWPQPLLLDQIELWSLAYREGAAGRAWSYLLPAKTSSSEPLKVQWMVLHCMWSKREGTGWAHPGFCSYFPSVKAHQGIRMDYASCSHLKDLGCWKRKWQEVTWILTFPASREMTQFACCSSKWILLILKDFIYQGPFIHFCMNFKRKQRMRNELHSLTYINTN